MKAIVLILLVGISLSYNPGAAVSYAHQYCQKYNKNYNNYKNSGGDCANFVSQCMHNGGQNFAGCSGVDGKGMIPGVTNLKNCLGSRGWRYSGSKPAGSQAGYPIFAKGYSHAMLATGFDGNKIIYCGHTRDRCDARIDAGSVDFYTL